MNSAGHREKKIKICNEIYYPGNRVGVLLLHSLSGTPQKLEFLAKALSRANFTVLAPCLSGHGTDPAHLFNAHYSQWLNEVNDSIKRLKAMCEKVYIIGDSLGGGLGIVASLTTPVSGIITMSTPIIYRRHRIWNIALKTIGRWMEYYVKKDSGYKSYKKVPIKTLNEAYRFTNHEVRGAISKVDAPIMIIQGKKDPIVHPKSAQYIFNHMKTNDKELVWIKDGEHSLATSGDREKIFSEIIDFINRQTKASNGHILH